jgi:hypothetical protein
LENDALGHNDAGATVGRKVLGHGAVRTNYQSGWDGGIYELRILTEAQQFLDHLYHNPEYAKSLRVPDGSRVIFDTVDKYEGMKKLSFELDDLLKEVSIEQVPSLPVDISLAMRRAAIESLTMA